MTRKQFIALAQSLKELRADLGKASTDGCDNAMALAYEAHVKRVMEVCKASNAAFDKQKFYSATL